MALDNESEGGVRWSRLVDEMDLDRMGWIGPGSHNVKRNDSA
jgi:hypothetical protein